MTSALLPPGSGAYTEAIADANDTNGRLAGSLDLIRQIGRTVTPPDWLPWLLRNAGLQKLMPYVDWQVLWEKGPAWLSTRGTPQASIDALSWIGWGAQFEDGEAGTSHYDRYQIHLDRVPWRSELERIIGVERFAKSTDSLFFRLVHGYDVRAVRGARSRYGNALFARSSGVDVRPDWPRLSFRVNAVMIWPASTIATSAEALTVMAWASRRGDIVYGSSVYGSRPKPGPVFAMELSDSATISGALARTQGGDRLEPVAGVVGGRTRFGSRQAVFLPLRFVSGETPRLGFYRFGSRLRPAVIERIMRVADPASMAGAVNASSKAETFDRLTDLAEISVSPTAQASNAALGLIQIGTKATLENASWSGLPWGDEPFGTSPRVQATEETT